MSCALTQAYTLDCSDSVGGIKNVYICAWGDIVSYAAASGAVSAIGMNTGKTFFKYELEKETGEFSETETRNLQNGTTFYEPVVKFTVRRLQSALRNELNQMAKLRLIAVVLDRNGNYWVAGLHNGLEKSNSKAQTGKGFGDYNGYDIELHGKEEQPMYSIAPALLSGIITPGL